MNVWAVPFQEIDFTDQLYAAALALVDADSQARAKRFYHRRDAYRCLLGRLLPRLLLQQQYGIPPKDAIFGRTEMGKPFVANGDLERAIGFNISHDNGYVVMAFQTREGLAQNPSDRVVRPSEVPRPIQQHDSVDVTAIGVDVMKIALPRYEQTLTSFVNNISAALTPLERSSLLGDGRTAITDKGTADAIRDWHGDVAAAPSDFASVVAAAAASKAASTPTTTATTSTTSADWERLRDLYLIWTLKEAYTKALGRGLGFDFRRVEVDVRADPPCVRVDGALARGWEFVTFELRDPPLSSWSRPPRSEVGVSISQSLESQSQSHPQSLSQPQFHARGIANRMTKDEGAGGGMDVVGGEKSGAITNTAAAAPTDTDQRAENGEGEYPPENQNQKADKKEKKEEEVYQVAVARYTGDVDGVTGHVAMRRGLVAGNINGEGWLSAYDAGELIERLSSCFPQHV